MKKLIIFFALMFFIAETSNAQVQFLGSPTTTIRNRGNFVSDSLFYFPKRQKLPTDSGAGRYNIADSSLYLYTGYQWLKTIDISDTSTMLGNYVRHAGYGLTKSGQGFLVDTLNISTRAWRQKGDDSLAALITAKPGGSGTLNYVPKWTATNTLGNSQIIDNGTLAGINTTNPLYRFDVNGNFRTVNDSYFATSSGNVGVGLTTTASKFHVKGGNAGNLKIDNGGEQYVQMVFERNTANNSGADFLLDGTGGTFGVRTLAAYPFTISTAASAGSPQERMRIHANGRVGVNTTTDAGYQFDVNGTGRFAGALRAQGTIQATNGNDNNSGDFLGLLIGSSSGATARTASIIKNTSSPYDLTIRSQDNTATTTGSLIFLNGSTEHMRINSSGDVGINQASPSYKLDINGTLRSVNGANFATSSGNVGIGTISPQAKLDVQGKLQIGEGGSLAFTGTSTVNVFKASNPRISFYDNVDHEASIGVATAGGTTYGALTFNVGQNTPERMRITSEGNVGIGTASPISKLEVINSLNSLDQISAGTDTTHQIKLGANTNYAEVQGIRVGVAFDKNLILQRQGGEVLIATTSDAGDYKLQVVGNARIGGALNLVGASSQLKIDTLSNINVIQAVQTLSGSNASSLISGKVTWNTTGTPSLIDIEVVNTAVDIDANYIKITDGTNMFRVTKTAGIITGAPSGGTASEWKLGSISGGSVTLNTGQFLGVDINGTFYKIALVN